MSNLKQVKCGPNLNKPWLQTNHILDQENTFSIQLPAWQRPKRINLASPPSDGPGTV